MLKRIFFFILTNVAVLAMISIVLFVLRTFFGIQVPTNGMLFALIYGMGGSFISLWMSKWIALRGVGGRVIEQPANESERWLVDVIARQAQTAGIKMPQVAIYDSPDVNAFATGPSRNNSLVAVSTGLLQSMTADEAEAVLGHEVSHVANGDMVTMALIQGVLNAFVIMLSRVVANLVAGGRDGENSGGMMYFAVVMVLQIVFGLLASLVQMWFSRHREFRADIGGARLAGREKMIAALQRLKSRHEPDEMPKAIAAFAINGRYTGGFSELFMTHPPLEKRIAALQASVQ
ncbi:protease HtpX [Luteimonas sp. FXH3W]|mgnify:CR=1 FL=1|jgi:heat shock protein HtpX|uniref:Protease HtpX n=1 Tax=Aquilutibacter rugosus TaxID=3115820 RepID=A0ABU7V1P2_9GAMM